MNSKPNILLITTDQQRFDHMGLAGLKAIQTPNLDRLGTEGVHARRSYCPSPICTPTRLSLLTGLYPSQHSGYSIGTSPDPFPEYTIPAALSKAGYETGIIGKTHFVARPEEERHISGEETPEPDFYRSWTGPYAGFDYVQAGTGHTINKVPAMHYRNFLEDAGADYAQWFPQMAPGYDHHTSGKWDLPQELHDTWWVTERTKDFVERNQDKPWFCWASYEDPHEPFVCPEPWFSSVDTDKMPDYEAARLGEFDDKPKIYDQLHRDAMDEINESHGIPCIHGDERHEAQRHSNMQATLGMIAFIDHKVGELIKSLERTGQLDNTLIVFTSDHGELHGHHSLWGKGMTAYEDCQRVPLLIWGPNLFSRRGNTDELMSLVDLPASFLALAGVDDYPHTQGRNLLPFLREEKNDTQDSVIVECRATQENHNQVSLITRRHKLVITMNDPMGELYDLSRDPDQYNNLWNKPDYATVKADLLEQLAQKRLSSEPTYRPRKSFG